MFYRFLCRFAFVSNCLIAVTTFAVADDSKPVQSTWLSARNLEAPFPYVLGGERDWSVFTGDLPAGTRIELTARHAETVLGSGPQVQSHGATISVTPSGRLRVVANQDAALGAIRLELAIQLPAGEVEKQSLELRPAPPDRPISYYADFGDDLIRIFMNSSTGRFEPVTKPGFDQYFRRLQAHGTRRLIVWLSPFPFIADPANYDPEDWRRYVNQSQAILSDELLTRVLDARTGFASWSWLRYLLATRLDRNFGRLLSLSAQEHGIYLTVCYRPFEAALTKYYEVPAFDENGEYLWGFLPLASPTVNYHPHEVGWRHYRDVLRELGNSAAAELATVELPGVTNPEQFVSKSGFQIVASSFPPLADDSFVLVRDTSQRFHLRPFEHVRTTAESRQVPIQNFRVHATKDGLILTGVTVPPNCRYLLLSWIGEGDGPDLSTLSPVNLHSVAGNRLGRETTYWVVGGRNDQTRVAGITSNGEYRAEFQSSDASQRSLAAGPSRLTMEGRQLVIDLGADESVEMIDFNQRKARENAVKEIASVLEHPAFDEVILNTRTHVDLPVSLADGDQGTRPVGLYWHERRGPRIHLGLDKAYLPRSTSSLDLIRDLMKRPDGVEQVTTWQPNEWRDECQSKAGPRWRFARNRGTADGVRKLLENLEHSLPDKRIRIVVPPGESAVNKILSGLETLQQPSGGAYGRTYYDKLWPSNNHNPAIGEGLALIDLTGLSVQPAFLGSGGYLPGQPAFELYVKECLLDLTSNRGSRYGGPRSYFFEAQTTLHQPIRLLPDKLANK